MEPATLRILIVDDSPEDRELYKRLLRQDPEQEYEFLEAELGQEGLRLAREERPDCLLLDYRLPDVDGLEFLSRLLQEGEVPVIVLTGQGNESVAVQAMKSGAQDYILKGAISRQELWRAVQNAVEKVSLRHKVEERTAELARANLAKSAFLASMSHELRTPLNAIIGFSEMLIDQRVGPLNARQTEFLGDVLASGRHLLELINEVLDFSRVASGRVELLVAPLAVAPVAAEVVGSLRALALGKGIEVKRELDESFPAVAADPGRLRQIFYNLLSNAIKFTPAGGSVTIYGELWAAADGMPSEHVRISISDTGTGIRPEDQERIFREFERIESGYSRSQSGTGLGLTLARQLVELHGGRLWVESAGEGKGSTFHFTLPLASVFRSESG